MFTSVLKKRVPNLSTPLDPAANAGLGGIVILIEVRGDLLPGSQCATTGCTSHTPSGSRVR
jgi:hypothetical protein